MLDGEFTECLKDMLLDLLGVFLKIALHIGNGHGREVGAVDRIMDGDRDLVFGIVVDYVASDSCPHGLEIPKYDERCGSR